MSKNFFFMFIICLVNCGSNIEYNSDFNILMTAYPDQSSFGSYTTSDAEIVSFSINNGVYQRFTDDNNEDSSPSCSPSRDKILFCSDKSSKEELFLNTRKKLILLDINSKQTEIINVRLDKLSDNINFFDISNSVWSPNSNLIAFALHGLSNDQLVVYDLDKMQVLFNTPVPDIHKIRWSANGEYLAYQGIHTSVNRNELSLLFELGFIDLNKKDKNIFKQTESLDWDLIGGIPNSNKFMIYYTESAESPIDIFEYDIEDNSTNLIITTTKRWPKECGKNGNEIFFILTADDNSEDIWLLDTNTKSFTQITFDGKSKDEFVFVN